MVAHVRVSSAGATSLRPGTGGRLRSASCSCGNGTWSDPGSWALCGDTGRGSPRGAVVSAVVLTTVVGSLVAPGEPDLSVGESVISSNDPLAVCPSPVSVAVPGVLTAEESRHCGSSTISSSK